MRAIRLTFHAEDDVWWVDSEDLPGFYAAADTLDEARREAEEGLSFALESDDFATLESFDAESQAAQNWGGSIKNAFTVANNVAESRISAFPPMASVATKSSDDLINSISNLNRSSTAEGKNTYPSGKLKALALV
ncbi:type II toxin-antitoxin system HicB family antitoxin [Bifidobacterium aquikefiri]|uniref:type II toxin-antitoxin system HicB family antitoxin n=1 Tax=Bifidobacterium aquikefiri TaxID=1653207 RepID=UPI0039ECB1FE